MLELLKNDTKRITHIPYETRHRIRQLAYFRMIHGSDLVCRQSTRMDRRCFAILCHLLRTIAGLTSTEVVDVKEMVAMFLHILVHDMKNRVIQQDFMRSGETISSHFNIVLLVVIRLHEELLKKPQPVPMIAQIKDGGGLSMTSSSRLPKHSWTKDEEAGLVELVNAGGWRFDNGTFRPGVIRRRKASLISRLFTMTNCRTCLAKIVQQEAGSRVLRTLGQTILLGMTHLPLTLRRIRTSRQCTAKD
uniref:DUF8040 domain-containing protein n=1 Tax=Cucumis melo TaxID=3656 RepID=A0A9I9E8B6_CUCME